MPDAHTLSAANVALCTVSAVQICTECLCHLLTVRGSAVQFATPVTVGVTVASPLVLLTLKSSCVLVALPGVMHTLALPGVVTSTVGLVLTTMSCTILSTSRQPAWSCWAVAVRLILKPGATGLVQVTVTISSEATARHA
jgi:hypothetical protein